MTDLIKINLLVQVAKLYYLHDLNQQAIADRLNISRTYVSKLISEAKRLGIVKITINDSFNVESGIETAMRETFDLMKVIVVPREDKQLEDNLKKLGTVAAQYIHNIVKDGDIIGVSWGATMYSCAQQLIKKDLKDVVITQLNGGLTRLDRNIYVSEILMKFAEAFSAVPYLLPLPAIVDNEEVKNAVFKDSSIFNTISLSRKANIAIFSVGEFGYNSILVKADYFKPNEVDRLLKRGVVGDICSRLITLEGEYKDDFLGKSFIGISLDELKEKEYRIAIAGGEGKIKCIYGALKSKYANVLITDEVTASSLLDMSKIYK